MLPEDEAKDSLRLHRFERRTSKPLLILAAVFIILVVLPYAVELGPSTISMIDGALLLIWAVFAVEFAIRLYLAPDKLTFLKRNPLDLLAVPCRAAGSYRGSTGRAGPGPGYATGGGARGAGRGPGRREGGLMT